MIASTNPRTADSSVASTRRPSNRAEFSPLALLRASNSSSWRQVAITAAPSPKNARLTARPSPPVPPATRATLPEKWISISHLPARPDIGSVFNPTVKLIKDLWISRPETFGESPRLLTTSSFPALLQQFRNQAGPASLVAGADTSTIIAMEIFMKEDELPPMRIALEDFDTTGHRAPTILPAQEDTREPPGYFRRDLPQVGFPLRMSRALDLEILAIVVVELLQRLDEQIVHRKPDRPAPVGIAAEQTRGGFGGLVIHAIDMAVDRELVRMIQVITRQSADSAGGEEFGFVEHAREDALQLLAVDERQQAADAARRPLRHFDVLRDIGMIVDEPLHAALEAGKTIHNFGFERLDGEQRDQPHHRTDLQEVLLAMGETKDVIVEAVLCVPQRNAIPSHVVHRVGDVDKVLEEFAGDILVGGILLCKLERNRKHIQAIHAHPTRAVGLLEMPAGWERRGAVENSDVIEAQEAALEDVHAFGIFAIDPPGKVEEKLVEDSFEKGAVGGGAEAPLDLVDAPSSPGVHRRIDVAEGPLISGKLAVWVHVPFAEKQDELVFGEIRVNERQGNAVKSEVPRRVPGIRPLVWHGENVLVIQMRPVLVAAVPAIFRRGGTGGVAFQPGAHVIMIKLLRPEHSSKSLTHDLFRVFGEVFRDAGRVEFFRLGDALGKESVKSGAEVVGTRHSGLIFSMPRSGDRADHGRAGVHARERFHVAKAKFDGCIFACPQLKAVVRGELGALLCGIDGVFSVPDDKLVKSIFDVRSAVGRAEDSLAVGFVLGKEQFGSSRAEQPTFSVLKVLEFDASAPGH